MGIAFKYTTNVSQYGKSTGMLIAGRCNRYSQAFQDARARGAEVLAYINAASRPNNRVCSLDEQFYMGNYGSVPLWPYPSYGQRQVYSNTKMTDLRPGSKWILHVVSYVEQLMRERKVDGVFLDVIGARPWASIAEWGSWSLAEKNAWTDGAIDLVRRLDAKRRAINPDFIIVNNNVWHRPDTTRGNAGEQYVDGISLEHPKYGSAWHKNYVARRFGNLGHRRVLVIANNREEARGWSNVPGVTHVSDQLTPQYQYPNPPVVGFDALNDR